MPEKRMEMILDDNDRKDREPALKEDSRDQAQGHQAKGEHAQNKNWVAEDPYCRIRSVDGKKVASEKAYLLCGPDCDSELIVLLFVVAAAEKCGKSPPRPMSPGDSAEVTK